MHYEKFVLTFKVYEIDNIQDIFKEEKNNNFEFFNFITKKKPNNKIIKVKIPYYNITF